MFFILLLALICFGLAWITFSAGMPIISSILFSVIGLTLIWAVIASGRGGMDDPR